MTTISRAGEAGLLRRIARWCGAPNGRTRLLPHQGRGPGVPWGDDAAVVKMSTPVELVFTTDTLVEGTHFDLGLLRRFLNEKEAWRSLGRKAMAVNLSDLAAMGAVSPLFALTTFGSGGDISVDTVDNLYRGMVKLARYYGFFIAGGDTIRSDLTIISVTLVGRLAAGRPITRNGSRINDVLMLTGPLGLSAAGLEILENQVKSQDSYTRTLVRSHVFPSPKMLEGRILGSEANLATSLIDTSDDLMTSLEALSAASGVGFEVRLDDVPVHPAMARHCAKAGSSPYRFILYGGEDYQLLFTTGPSNVGKIRKRIPGSYVLGRVRPKSYRIQVWRSGRPFRMKDTRFRHF